MSKDLKAASTYRFSFTTSVDRLPTVFTGSPAVAVYKDANTTEVTTGVTLTASYDSKTGFNLVEIDLSSDGSFYAAGSDFQVMITAGTVGGTALAGTCVGSFSIEKNPVNWAKVSAPTTAVDLSGTTIKTTQKVDVDTIKTNPVVNGGTITFPNATLASTTNITAGTITTVTNLTNAPTAGDFTATMKASTLARVTLVDTATVATTATNLTNAPTNGDFTATMKAATLARVTLVDTTTTNTDMRGTNSAALAATALSTADWTSGRAAYLDNLAALKVKKNTQLAAFPFLMVLTSDHITAATGVTVTATRSIDGGAFGACSNAVAEISNGVYKITLSAADLNGDTIVLKFTATSCDQRTIVIATQP